MPSDAFVSCEIDNQKKTEELEIEELVQSHQQVIHALAGRMRCEQISREELIQAGNLGLLRAVSHYDASRDVKLITYALPWILGEMRRACRRMLNCTYSLDQQVDGEGQSLYDVLIGECGIDIIGIDLRLALSRLNPDEQILICLRYYRDKTQKETAFILKKSQAQISKMERHALDTLHALLS